MSILGWYFFFHLRGVEKLGFRMLKFLASSNNMKTWELKKGILK